MKLRISLCSHVVLDWNTLSYTLDKIFSVYHWTCKWILHWTCKVNFVEGSYISVCLFLFRFGPQPLLENGFGLFKQLGEKVPSRFKIVTAGCRYVQLFKALPQYGYNAIQWPKPIYILSTEAMDLTEYRIYNQNPKKYPIVFNIGLIFWHRSAVLTQS